MHMFSRVFPAISKFLYDSVKSFLLLSSHEFSTSEADVLFRSVLGGYHQAGLIPTGGSKIAALKPQMLKP